MAAIRTVRRHLQFLRGRARAPNCCFVSREAEAEDVTRIYGPPPQMSSRAPSKSITSKSVLALLYPIDYDPSLTFVSETKLAKLSSVCRPHLTADFFLKPKPKPEFIVSCYDKDDRQFFTVHSLAKDGTISETITPICSNCSNYAYAGNLPYLMYSLCCMQIRPKSILIVHGGELSKKDRSYIGFERELMSIPHVGPIGYTYLLSRIQSLIMKPKSKFVYQVVALVKSATGDTARIKFLDDFDLVYVLDELEAPVLYISTTPINEELLEAVNDHATRLNNGTNPVTNASGARKTKLGRDLDKNLDTNVNMDSYTNLNRDLDRDSDMDLDRNLDPDLDRIFHTGVNWNEDWRLHDRDLDGEGDHDLFVASGNRTEDDVESLENIPIGSLRCNVTSVGSRNDVFEGDHEYVGQWIIMMIGTSLAIVLMVYYIYMLGMRNIFFGTQQLMGLRSSLKP